MILRKIPLKYLIISGISLILVLSVALFFALKPTPARYDLETGGAEPDFETAFFHSAEDGIAVVGKAKSLAEETGIPLAAKTGSLTSDPESIWGEVLVPTALVGGYTSATEIADKNNYLGSLSIPVLGMDASVFESGDNMQDMSHGIAHFPHSSVWDGNVCFSAHNINLDGSWGYFYAIHTLKAGDEITYKTSLGERIYKVSSVSEISENDWSALTRTEDNRLTLITCISGKPALRLCVQAIETVN